MARQWNLAKISRPFCVALSLTGFAGLAIDTATAQDEPISAIVKEAAPAEQPEAIESGDAEVIRERYPNRKVKIEREVVQDADGNYVNHGPWKMWDPNGNVIAEGAFHYGQRHGVWNRWYQRDDAKLLSTVPYDQFQAPFVSQAKFENGKLHGKWSIYDAKQRKVSEWSFDDGERHGVSTWLFVNGRTLRKIEYKHGAIEGQFIEWDASGQVSVNDKYEEGRKIDQRVGYFKDTQHKQWEGTYLRARIVVHTSDDWWNAVPATFTTQGNDEKHGVWIDWHENGQMARRGEFRHDVPVGQFTWWYANGQKSLEGEYASGKQTGKWVWWHENGVKKIQGYYEIGNPTGPWLWWHDSGKVAQRADFSDPDHDVIIRENGPSTANLPDLLPSNEGRPLKR